MPETPTVPDGRPVIHPPGGGSSDSPTVPSLPADQQSSPSVEPRAFGRFELLEELGSGGMGTVYKARQLDLGRIVALKTLHGSLGASQSLIERFLREARAAANLDHPGLVRVFEVGCLEGTYFFTMEYVRGQSLLDKVSRGPVPLAERIRWVRDAALAVHHAHLEGLVHRDIKPQNILLDTEGRVKVADFGLVRGVSEGRGLTITGQVLGTPIYMPPEQARGEWERIGPASDVYALGATLYELASGKPPVHGDDTYEVLARVKRGEVTPLRSADPRLPRDLDTVCMKAMDPTPEKRYASAAQLAEDLDRLLRLEPVHARPLSPPERALRWARRRWKFLALALGVAALVSAPAGLLWKARRRDAEAARSRTEAYRLFSLATDPARVLAEGGVDWARARLADTLRLDPDCKEAHLRLAILHEWSGEADSAVASYQRALAIDPSLSRARFRLFVLRALQAGAADEEAPRAQARSSAERELAALLELAPSDPYARLAGGVREALTTWGPSSTRKQVEADIRRLQSLLDDDPSVRDLPEGRFLLAGLLGAFYHPSASDPFRAAEPFHDPDRALRLLEELVKQDPLDLLSQMNLGVLRFELGDLRGAEDRFRSLEREAPGWPEPHYYLGRALLAQTRFEEAIPPLEAAKASKEDLQTWALLALVLWLDGNDERALALCDESIARESATLNARDVRRLRAIILHGMGRIEEAREESRRLRGEVGAGSEDAIRDIQAQLQKPQVRWAMDLVRGQLQDFPDLLFQDPKRKHAIRATLGAVERLPQFARLKERVPASSRTRTDLLMTLSHAEWIERERPQVWAAMEWYFREAGVQTDVREIALLASFVWDLKHDEDLRKRAVLFTLAEHHWQAGLFYRLGRPAEAEGVLEAAIERYGPDARTLYGLATMRAIRGDAPGCAAALRRAQAFGWRETRFVTEDADFARVASSPEVKAVLDERK